MLISQLAPYYSYIRKIFTDVDPNVAKTLAVNFFINATLVGWPKEKSSVSTCTSIPVANRLYEKKT